MRTCCEQSISKPVEEASAYPSPAEQSANQATGRSPSSVSDLTPGDLMERDSLASCFRKAEKCVTREILGETIIVPVCNRVGDLGSIYVLDEVGTAIWELLDGEHSVARIVASLREEYEVGEEEVAQDAIEFLTVLDGAGLIGCSGDNTHS